MELDNDWKPITPYLTYRLTLVKQLTDDISLYKVLTPTKDADSLSKEHEGGYYLRQHSSLKKNDKVLKLRPHEANKILKQDTPYLRGPFVFHYGFEDTPEAKYVLSLLPYIFNLKPKAKQRIVKIMLNYKDYIKLDNRTYLDMCEICKNSCSDKSKWLFE